MCGIVGILTLKNSPGHLPASPGDGPAVLNECLSHMVGQIQHRGPDDQGFEVVQGGATQVGLGQTRLSILDLSSAGHQPMQDRATGNWISYNGEIYNYLRLREELGAKSQEQRAKGEEQGAGSREQGATSEGQRGKSKERGVRSRELGAGNQEEWRSGTDTEVVLKAYARWGRECLHRLRGMFAFGLWDQQQQELFLARDPYGIKPLYYYQTEGLFVFASEIRALLASGLVPRKLSVDGLESYLSFGSVQDPLTIIDGVRSLLPGHSLVVQSNKRRVCVEDVYYAKGLFEQDAGQQKNLRPLDRNEAVITLRSLLEESVQLHLVSDVPLGVFLSGGIDSSALVGLMSSVTKQRPQTFSVSFPEEEFSERSHAELVARRFGTKHQDLHLAGQDLLAMLPDALAAMDQPTMDAVNSYVISKAVKNAGISVALSGLGGDELFAGYPSFYRLQQLKRLDVIPESVRCLVARTGHTLMGGGVSRRKTWDLLAGGGHARSVYTTSRQLFAPQEVEALIAYQGRADCMEEPFQARETDGINAMSQYELCGYMTNTLLRDTDQMSMAHALEVRVPFIDPVVVSFVLGLPGKWKFDGSRPKPLLLDALGHLLPQEVWRRPKMGFILPFERWMNTVLTPELDQVFCEHEELTLFGLKPDCARTVWQTFKDQPQKERWTRPWALYVLAKWLHRHNVTV